MENEAPEITIRTIDPIEYEAAGELIKPSLGEYDAFDYDTDTADLNPDRMEDLYEEPKGRFWVAEVEGAIIGTLALRRMDDRCCQVRRLAVHPDYRRHDVAQRLLAALEEYATGAGYRRVIAEGTARQKPATVFLESSGFEEFKRSLRRKNIVITYEKSL